MSLLTPPPGSSERIRRFLDNEFDLAGLADLPPDDKGHLDDLLRRVYRYAVSDYCLDDEKLAETLHAMIRLAQEEYDGNFWGRYEERVGWPLDDSLKDRLGNSFQLALRRFGYPVPEVQDGHRRLTPILMHAGAPKVSIPLLVRLIHQHRDVCEDLDAAEIKRLVESDGVALHANVKRLLTSRMRGAVQVWRSVARVVVAWPDVDRVDEELDRLSPGLDRVSIRAALDGLDRFTAAIVREPVPRLLYDRSSGEVRLWVPGGDGEWKIKGPNVFLSPWQRSGAGRSAEVMRPLPTEFAVRSPTNIVTSFLCQPEDNWPGLWFRASNGHLRPGDDIDRDGLEPGRWLVAFEGTPDGPLPGTALPLNWSFVKGGGAWTAWDVDVPPRTPGREVLTWKIGPNEFSVPLARRTGPRLEIVGYPIAVATSEGLEVCVFDAPPTVASTRSGVLARLSRRLGGRWLWVQDLDLAEGQSIRLPADGPGVYQLSEARNVGRILLDFAVLPGFGELSTEEDPDYEHTVWTLSADPGLGRFHRHRDLDHPVQLRQAAPNLWEFTASTIEPYLRVEWVWADAQHPSLLFGKPIEGLRWRVRGLSTDEGRWTRSTLVIDPKEVVEPEVRIEVQAPGSQPLWINGAPGERAADGPSGRTFLRDLLAYKPEEHVRLGFQGRDRTAVLLAARPRVERLRVEADEDAVVVNWWPGQLDGTVLMAWDPLAPDVAPIAIHLTSEELEEPGEWQGTWGNLPASKYVSLTLGRRVSVGLRRQTLLATAMEDSTRSVARLTPRTDEGVGVSPWVKVAHDVVLALRAGRKLDPIKVRRWIEQIEQAVQLDLANLFEFSQRLRGMEVIGAEGRENRDGIVRVIDDYVKGKGARLVHDLAGHGPQPPNITLGDLLRNDIHPGWHPGGAAAIRDLFPGYPFGYMADLAVVSTPGFAAETRPEVGHRIEDWHTIQDLPDPSLALPWRWGPSRHESCPKAHIFDLPPQAVGSSRNDGISCELGLEDWALDVIELDSSEGPKPKVLWRKFSLYWEVATGKGWAIEKLAEGGPRRLCCPRGGRLLVPPPDPIAVAERLDLRGRLIRWGTGQPSFVPGWMASEGECPFDHALKQHARLGSVHAHVLEPPKLLEIRLWGKTMRHEPERPPLPGPSLVAWRLAWWDRMLASGRATGPGEPDRRRFLNALADALDVWPELMPRCLALAEFLRWTLCEGGLGLAFKFGATSTTAEQT